VELEELGMNSATLAAMSSLAQRPHGMLLVTGPTGSGKTTTLYATLLRRNAKAEKIITVEDPVEYQLPGITQMPVHQQAGVTFGAALRSILRQDPDVIMVGEIRDEETARIAVQASLTGHLVLSTLHTNDAPSSITRLVNIGIEPYLIAASVNSVLAQRLVRRLCENCKTVEKPLREGIAKYLAKHNAKIDQVYRAAGCSKCRQTGYAGRLGIYETLEMSDPLRDLVTSNPSLTEFRRGCHQSGTVSLREDGLRKVAAGLTTVEEIARVTEAD
jgi:type II secretory ATPase GspE/PulE/Tfp pilus assembly ATPase PilB-like protein